MIDRVEETLRKLLSDPSAAVREAASGALDRTLAKRAVEAFRARIRSGSVEERIRAVHSAGEMGGAEGVSLLVEALADPDAEVRGVAVRSLASFPSPPVLKALWEMLPRERGTVLGNILEALGASGRKELAPHVEKFLDHADPEVRSKAVSAFARMSDAAGWERILEKATDPNESVRAAAAAALGGWTSRP
jgi:HEAT repeat protein